MLVFNLTDSPVEFHGHTIAPGGSAFIKGLQLSARDLNLAHKNKLSFGQRPRWYNVKKASVKETVESVSEVAGFAESMIKEEAPKVDFKFSEPKFVGKIPDPQPFKVEVTRELTKDAVDLVKVLKDKPEESDSEDK